MKTINGKPIVTGKTDRKAESGTENLPVSEKTPETVDLSDYFRPSIDRLRFILMFFLSILLMGFPTDAGTYVQIVCGFVPIAFFILSGYLVLREADDRAARILRTIKRTAVTFAVLCVFYFVINLFYYSSLSIDLLPAFKSERVWFNFLVLNIWPFDIGTAIWYVQAQLYAYIFIYILEKLNLLRFDWLIALIFLIPTVLTGELSGVIDFNIFQYTCISGNFFTRAIPYILIGCFMHRRNALFYRIHRSTYALGIALGAALALVEVFLLNNLGVSGYYGHLLGMPIIAISVCMIALKDRNDFGRTEQYFIPSRTENRIFYYLLQLAGTGVSALSFVLLGTSKADSLNTYISFVAFAVCYAVILVIKFIKQKHQNNKYIIDI